MKNITLKQRYESPLYNRLHDFKSYEKEGAYKL